MLLRSSVSPFLKSELTQIEDVEALTGRKFNEFNCAPATGNLIDFESFDQAQVKGNLAETAKVVPRAESDAPGISEAFVSSCPVPIYSSLTCQ